MELDRDEEESAKAKLEEKMRKYGQQIFQVTYPLSYSRLLIMNWQPDDLGSSRRHCSCG